MITIKLPFVTTDDNIQTIEQLQKQLSSVVRYCYNRGMEGIYRNDMYRDVVNKWPETDSWLLNSAVNEGLAMASSDISTEKSNRIFGGKNNFKQRALQKLSKEQIQQLRLLPLSIVGETSKHGNRKFELDIENSLVIFKLSRNQKILLTLPKLKNNYKKLLTKLQQSAENSQVSYQVKLTNTDIFFSFDDTKLETNINYTPIATRHAGIDLNPNYIALSIFDEDNRLFSRMWKLSDLTINDSDNSSYLVNKSKHEISQISKQIQHICVGYNVNLLTIEDLSIKNQNHNKGKNFNRLVNNVWNRKLTAQLIEKRCKRFFTVKKVFPHYSSFIGNLIYQLPDPISAACEIARRGYKRKEFYPMLINVCTLKNLWKEEVEWPHYKTWKELFTFIKDSKMRYRVPIPAMDGFQKFICNKTCVLLYDI